MTDNKETDLFCIDCDTITRQKYKGILSDGSHLYICKECGLIIDRDFNASINLANYR